MSKPEFSKPFCLEHAKAAAPYCCRDGRIAQVLKWDRNVSDYPLMGVVGKSDDPRTWTATGSATYGSHGAEYDCDLVMLPLGFIDGKPVFVGDEYLGIADSPAKAQPMHAGMPFTGCKWPAPAPAYPTTQMRLEDFDAAIIASGSKECISAGAACAIANAALRHSIDAGQVVPSDVLTDSVRKAYADGQAIAYKHEAGGRAARDLAIALAVQNSCMSRCEPIAGRAQLMRALGDIDLSAIIAGFGGAKDAKEGAK